MPLLAKASAMTLMMKTPQPINGTRIATGDEVESRINASFWREMRRRSVSGWNTGPTIRGVPRSEKKIRIPPSQAPICARARLVTSRVAERANAAPPPDHSMSLTKPPMNASNTSTLAL